MGTIRFAIALIVAKLGIVVLKMLGSGGTDFPGKVAIKICPDFLDRIEKPRKIVGVTGTNGKTTVANLISDCIRSMDIDVLNNAAGSNMDSGIATCLARGVSLFGRVKYGTAVLEIDEKSVRRIFPYVEPDILLVTNLSRDSIMRNGHPEYIQQILTHYMPRRTKLILNADDLLASGVSPSNSRRYFGIAEMPGDKKQNTNLIDDNAICPVCNKRLAYRYNRYSNIGKAYCPSCGYKAPEYDYKGELITAEEAGVAKGEGTGKYVKVSSDKRQEVFPLIHDSVFNMYNEVAAIATLIEMGVRLMDIRNCITNMAVTSSRYNVKDLGAIKVISMLCKEKNAYAATRVFEYIAGQPGDKEILLLNNCIGDTKHWSENTCWLYDCDFELLNESSIKRIVVYGDRALDLKFRMLLAGINESRIICVEDYRDAADKLKYFEGDNIYVLYGTDSLKVGREAARRAEELALEAFPFNGRKDKVEEEAPAPIEFTGEEFLSFEDIEDTVANQQREDIGQ